MQTLSDILHSAAALEGGGAAAINARAIEARFCMIGGGGGIVGLAILTAFPSVTLDVVEIDQRTIEIARDYFGFYTSSSNQLAVYNSDGRDFLKEARGYYDVILLDAVQHRSESGVGSVPLRLMTYNFLKEMVRSLQQDRGVVLFRINSGDLRDVLATYIAAFGAGRVWYTQVEPPNVHLVVAFHFKELTTSSQSVIMCRELFGRSSIRFLRGDDESGGGEQTVTGVLCDPGDNGCWKK
jgi:spermidine synthase